MDSTCSQGRLTTIVSDTVASFEPQMRRRRIRWAIDCPPDLLAPADPPSIRSTVTRLIEHAIDRMMRGGDLDIVVVSTPRGIEIEVADTGPTPAVRPAGAVQFLPRSRSLPPGSFLEYEDCPQGGWAVTWVLPAARALRAAA